MTGSVDETLPFKFGWDPLRGRQHVGVHCLISLRLTADELVERRQCLLDDFYNMLLKRDKVGLDTEDVLAVIVFLNDLLVQAMVHSAMEDVRIIGRRKLASSAFET